LVHIHHESLAIRTGNSTAVGLKGMSGLNTAFVQIACFVFRAVFLGKTLNMNRTVWHFSQAVFVTGKTRLNTITDSQNTSDVAST